MKIYVKISLISIFSLFLVLSHDFILCTFIFLRIASSIQLGLQGQRTFLAKTLPCYWSTRSPKPRPPHPTSPCHSISDCSPRPRQTGLNRFKPASPDKGMTHHLTFWYLIFLNLALREERCYGSMFGPQTVTFWYPSTSATNRCFFHDDGHYGVAICTFCSGAVIPIFPSTLTSSELYPETSLFVEIHLPPKAALSNMLSHQICLSPW